MQMLLCIRTNIFLALDEGYSLRRNITLRHTMTCCLLIGSKIVRLLIFEVHFIQVATLTVSVCVWVWVWVWVWVSGCGSVGVWVSGCGSVGVWVSGCGSVGVWVSGCGSVVVWASGCGSVVVWASGCGSVQWLCGLMGVGQWLCGLVGVGQWLCGLVGVGQWVCGSVGVGQWVHFTLKGEQVLVQCQLARMLRPLSASCMQQRQCVKLLYVINCACGLCCIFGILVS